jgi:FkbM family methyltransferase
MEAAVGELRAAGLDPTGKLFIDVGANIGTSTIDALLHFGFGRAVCFEPDADNVRLLRANLVLNQLDERATVHALAVSNRDGFGTLQRSPTNSGDHRFSTENGAGRGQVACARLDRFVEEGAVDAGQVGLVWIDAQGHEPQILAGATRLLEAQVPVVLEYCPWLLGESIQDLDQTIAARYSAIVDLGRAADGLPDAHLTPEGLPALGRQFARRGYADLLLLPRA